MFVLLCSMAFPIQLLHLVRLYEYAVVAGGSDTTSGMVATVHDFGCIFSCLVNLYQIGFVSTAARLCSF